MSTISTQAHELLARMGVAKSLYTEGTLTARSPVDGAVTGKVVEATAAEMSAAIGAAHAAFLQWRVIPAPKRGELVRKFGEVLRTHKTDLAALVSLEAGKIASEGLGEVQEMIDICDFAVGLSRQLHGLTIASERPGHRMMEQWLPLGVVGIISAFNFPVAVWAWNSALALVAGDTCVWKPSAIEDLALGHRRARAVRKGRGRLQGRCANADAGRRVRCCSHWAARPISQANGQ